MTLTDPQTMATGDIESEISMLQEHFDECARIGQGISTKEGSRMRRLQAEFDARQDASMLSLAS